MGLFRPKTKCGDRWITRRREIERQLVQKFRSLVIHSLGWTEQRWRQKEWTRKSWDRECCGCFDVWVPFYIMSGPFFIMWVPFFIMWVPFFITWVPFFIMWVLSLFARLRNGDIAKI